MSDQGISRRTFVIGGVAAGTAAALGGCDEGSGQRQDGGQGDGGAGRDLLGGGDSALPREGGADDLEVSDAQSDRGQTRDGPRPDGASSDLGRDAGPNPALLFFDDFGYIVSRSADLNAADGPQRFVSEGGWSGFKDFRSSFPGAGGYLYTTDSVPGFTGQLPGSSGRVLCQECLVTSVKVANGGINQTDFYLQLGGNGPGAIPADVWFQFWIYAADVPGYASRFARGNKFLYPTNSGYPATDYPWLVSLGTAGHETDGTVSYETEYSASCLFSNRPPGADFSSASEYPTNRDKLGQNLGRTAAQLPNVWYLYKMHIDTSGAQGVWQLWRRELGVASWTPLADWRGGVTPDFSWPTSANARTGAQALRWPTTLGYASDLETNYDSWRYIADFTMAAGEAGLPIYPY